jgi:hypothetical protein
VFRTEASLAAAGVEPAEISGVSALSILFGFDATLISLPLGFDCC